MKTYNERKADISARIHKKRQQRRILSTTCLMLALVLVAGLLMWPWVNDSETLAQAPKFNGNAMLAPSYHQVAKYLVQAFDNRNDVNEWKDDFVYAPGTAMPSTPDYGDLSGMVPPSGNGSYEEVTDNQVEGVTEADLFKRSDKYIFYLRGTSLEAYSIAAEASQMLGTFQLQAIDMELEGELSISKLEMYLSQDCSTLTVILQPATYVSKYTSVISIDVSDPANMRELERTYISGQYLSSRMVDGKLLLITRYQVNEAAMDEEDLTSYIPHYGCEGNWVTVRSGDIFYPEDSNDTCYSMISTLEEKSLNIIDSVAGLGYYDQLYVSKDHIFVTDQYFMAKNNVGKMFTEVVCIGYADGGLTPKGSAVVEGRAKDQYSFDEYEGVLRIVTTIEWYLSSDFSFAFMLRAEKNASLYCVSLESFDVIGSVECFAPKGESAQSVRFDAKAAYVCTAEVVTLTDPVYFFDLSDPANITYTDTGTIPGYSSSLVQLGDGFLLGVGYGETRHLKVEVYAQQDGKVVSVGCYQRECDFSEEYKTYFIDREQDRIGLPIQDWNGQTRYLLLQFDGDSLELTLDVQLNSPGNKLESVRSVVIEEYLYMLDATGLTVVPVN